MTGVLGRERNRSVIGSGANTYASGEVISLTGGAQA